MSPLNLAKALALLAPAALLAGAYGSQIWGGLYPCEMCYWQRWPHMAALAFAVVAILASGGIGVWHAGIEAGIFPGVTDCTATCSGTPDEILECIMNRPVIRCDEIQFQFLGVSMAGWNAILSISSALVIAWLSFKRPRDPALA